MSDDADKAQERLENWLEGNIRKVLERPSLKPIYQCYNCGETVTGQKLFCDIDCRNDYDMRERRISDSF